MLRYLPLRSTQSSSSVRVSKYFDSVTHTPVMPSQHLPQLPSEPARHSARSAALTLVAVVPSHVWPLGQAVHTLFVTMPLHASHPEQCIVSQPHGTDQGSA